MKDRESRGADWQAFQETLIASPSLWSAVRANDVTELERLVAANADIEARDYRGYSPLMLAAYLGHGEAFEYLITRGANPNSADFAGTTVLMAAAFMGERAIVVRLLESGADVGATNNEGLDAIAAAHKLGRTDVVQLLEDLRARR